MKKGVAAILIILCLLLGGAFAALYLMSDREGPEIIFDSEDLTYSDDMKKSELLEGVKAVDAVDGDVTDSLTVDAIFADEDDGTATVVYAAKDSENNVTKIQRKVEYAQDGEPKEDSEKEGETGQEGADADAEETKTPEETAPLSEEEQLAQANEAKIAALAPVAPKFYLKQYLVTIKVGEKIDSLSYVKEITDDTDSSEQLWRQIQLRGEYDSNTPGTYEQVFYVVDSNGNQSNEAALRIVVQ